MVTYDCGCKDVSITEGIFGEIFTESPEDKIRRYDSEQQYHGEESPSYINNNKLTLVKSYTMINKNHVEITVISWGATIVSLKYPDKFGHVVDVVLGFDDLESYTNPEINPFIGCVLGRCANRIKDGCVVIKGKTYQLTRNDFDKHHLHGGIKGFGRRLWESYIDGCSVVMTYLSEDGEEGYPGAVLCMMRFKLTPDNKLEIGIRATTTDSTIVNISHGSLFNLAGHDAGKKEMIQHKIALNCDRWTFADYTNPIPTGAIRGVGGTVMDLRIPQFLESCIEKVPPGEGYDHNFCITPNWHGGTTYVAQAVHPKTGRILEIYSDQPGVQFYTGGRLPSSTTSETRDNSGVKYDDNEEEYEGETMSDQRKQDVILEDFESPKCIAGKRGARYVKHCAFSIQPQNYPNAVNYPHFPSSILRPGQVYCHDLIYKFGIQLANYV